MSDTLKKLSRSFYERDTIVVAQELLGKYLVRKILGKESIGRIVEVEAYLGPHDLAAHTSKGMTQRNAVMFGQAGHAYVYFIYGKYHCVNAVTGNQNGSAVLLRALEPIQNISQRTQGPGLLCQALQITRELNGHDLLSEDFYIAESEDGRAHKIMKKKRIGVDYAKHWADRLLRFYVKGNSFISRK